ncbi:MAG: cell wall-binding repeat-containing protein, partial [Acidimicrobiales bacterium]
KAIDESPGAPVGINTAVLTTGNDFPDANSAGPIAFNKHYPIIITDGHAASLTPEASQVMADMHITHLIVAGGPAALNPSQYNSLPGVTIDEIAAGADRSFTAATLGDYEISNLGFQNAHFNLANGFNPATDLPAGAPPGFSPDALTGGPHSGNENAPLVLTLNPTTPGGANTFATEHASTEGSGHIFGGTAAVTDPTAASVASAAGATAQTPTTLNPSVLTGNPVPVPSTLGPDLLDCYVIADHFADGGISTMGYHFDKPVNILNPGGFWLAGYQLSTFQSSALAAIDSTDNTRVITTYTVGTQDPAFYTTCGVTDSTIPAGPLAIGGPAVNNVSSGGVTGPLMVQPLGGSHTAPGLGTGQTSAPDLLSAIPTPGDGTNTFVDFTFDKSFLTTAGNINANHFVMYDAGGNAYWGTFVGAVDLATKRVTIGFTSPGANTGSAVRFGVLNGPGADGGPPGVPGDCAVIAGGFAPKACAPSSSVANGSLVDNANPTVAAINRTSVNTFNFVMSQNVTPPIVANFLRVGVYGEDGTKYTPGSAADVNQFDAKTIAVRFPGVVQSTSPTIVWGAVETDFAPNLVPDDPIDFASIGGKPNAVSGAPIPTVLNGGPVDGPMTSVATIDGPGNNIQFTMNQNLTVLVGPPSLPDPTSFYVFGATNAPVAGASISGTTNNTITVHWAAPGVVAASHGAGMCNIAGAAEGNPWFNEGGICTGTAPNVGVAAINTDLTPNLHGNIGMSIATT